MSFPGFGAHLRIDDLLDLVHGRVAPSLHPDAATRMRRSAEAVALLPSIFRQKWPFLMGTEAPAGVADAELVRAFVVGHCAGVGAPLPVEVVRMLIAIRCNVLAQGHSGVRPELIDHMGALIEARITPVVPSQGSVGAAGDLAPLAAVARVLCGYGGAVWDADGGRLPTSPLPAWQATPKEALSLINGASLTTALGVIAIGRARRIVQALETACAMTMHALRADWRTLDPAANAARHHDGASTTAANLFALRGPATEVRRADPFSLRTAPVVIGALRAAVDAAAAIVEAEANAACDNPLWLEGQGLMEVGHFHGAPVALAMDQLRVALTQAVTQSERRTFRLVSNALTGDLPSFLVAGTGLNSGFMIAQYTAASLASECKGLSHPACVDTIPTMQHREDHVSMGPIAGRLTLRVLEAAADIVGIELLLAAQALDWRVAGRAWQAGALVEVPPEVLPPGVDAAWRAVRRVADVWTEDRELHPDLVAAGGLVRAGTAAGALPW